MNPERHTAWLTPRLVIGLLVVGFGLVVLFDNLGWWMDAGHLLRYWPFGLVLVGLVKLFQDPSRSGQIAGGLLCGVGILFAAEIFFFVRLDVWRWWPLAIIVFGLLIVSKAFQRQDPAAVAGPTSGSGALPGAFPQATSPVPGRTERTMSEVAIWSGVERRVSSPAFKHADLTAIMGGIEFDLRQAGTDQGEAVIDVFAMWGGIEITVPPDWAVSNQVTAIMGGANDQSTGTQQARHRLIVKGVVIMGGVDIKT